MTLQIQGLGKTFGSQQAVFNLTLEVKKGQVYGLLGRNGAGKSTTIKMILDLLTPTDGRITWDGKPLKEAGVSIGYLPEERGLYTKSKVNTQLAYFGRLEGMGKKEVDVAINTWLQRLGISEYKNKQVSELSKGNQQKVQLIATLLHDPELVILDEPFSGLDPVNANLFAEVIREEIARGKTVILSSHQMSLVEAFCDQICLMKAGEAVLQGNLKTIKENYEFRNLIVEDSPQVQEQLKELDVAFATHPMGLCVKVTEEKEGLAVLNQLIQAGIPLPQFQLLQPTLQEIFVEKVG